ncbi:hypothetical protein [Lacipirellula limnantheis]|uniref:hypothetical protein n=1 Tax=Lacipirellula limnantheis TaxID=2528024 RepID=UPI0011A96FD9|nr:hypothetical protein [Lacipirellula limnantheis]
MIDRHAMGLTRLFIVTTAIAVLLGCCVWLEHARQEVDKEACRHAYLKGHVTKEQARKVVGSSIDAWPMPDR